MHAKWGAKVGQNWSIEHLWQIKANPHELSLKNHYFQSHSNPIPNADIGRWRTLHMINVCVSVSASTSHWGYVMHMGSKNYDCTLCLAVLLSLLIVLQSCLKYNAFRLDQGWPSLSHSIIWSCSKCLSEKEKPHDVAANHHNVAQIRFRSIELAADQAATVSYNVVRETNCVCL